MSRKYGNNDEIIEYTWRDDLFGPKVSADEILELEMRSIAEGWETWFYMILGNRNRRKRRWLLAYLRDGVIRVMIDTGEDVYEDDNPWEGMG